jgi:D-sedoheptulose 7-phosphate isomerase
VERRLRESAEVKRQVAQYCTETIVAVAALMADSLRSGGKILLCGNGGSAADCQHIAGELVNFLSKSFKRPGLAALALTTDTSLLTAIANDCGFESVFERQVQTLGQPGDVLLGISTSGNSPNVVRAVAAAKEMRMGAVALTGSGGKLENMADITIAIPSDNTQYIQESHLAVEHLLCELVETYLFEEKA